MKRRTELMAAAAADAAAAGSQPSSGGQSPMLAGTPRASAVHNAGEPLLVLVVEMVR
jgi:hypothetical protein